VLAPFQRRLAASGKSLLGAVLTIVLAVILRKFPLLRLPTALVATSIFVILLLWLLPKWQIRHVVGLDSSSRFDRENEARKTLSQILGGLVLLVGFYFTWQNLAITRESQVAAEKATQDNLRIAQEGQITDRFGKAITQLGDTKIEIRLGAIYALERLAKDSPKDHWSIMEVLTAYVREHAKVDSVKKENQPSPPVVDIQSILTVFGRRTFTYEKGEDHRLDLRRTYLSEIDLRKGDLRGADLRETNLTSADVREAPRWTPQNRPWMDRSKPATRGASETGDFYPAATS
jgi:Pentapeptide repeats (8 copies)